MGIVKEVANNSPFDEALYNEIFKRIVAPLKSAMETKGKKAMYSAIDSVIEGEINLIDKEDLEKRKIVKEICEDILIKTFRKMVLEEGKRPDGRLFDEIRHIWCQVGVLPRTHGSAIFSRGETMALANCTNWNSLRMSKNSQGLWRDRKNISSSTITFHLSALERLNL